MGRKPFASKSNSTTYNLLYRPSTDANEAPQREWVESSKGVGIGNPDPERIAAEKSQGRTTSRYPPGHPLSWLEDETEKDDISEERRREIIALGFPDDGYDYLKHVRQGHGDTVRVEEEAAQPTQSTTDSGGPFMFVPAPSFDAPPDDYRAIDASRLTVHQAADEEDDAALIGGVARIFARELHSVRKKYQLELDEMETLVRQMEAAEDEKEAGDLLEDFVLSATHTQEEELRDADTEAGKQTLDEAHSDSGSEIGSDLEVDSDVSSSEGYHPKQPMSESRSFASTYWRPERADRNANLSVIDERFEQLALEYDSDEIGELDDLDEDQFARNLNSTDQYEKVMDKFLAVHGTDSAFGASHKYEIAGNGHANSSERSGNGSAAGLQEDEDAVLAAVAIAKAKEHVRRLEQSEAEPSSSRDVFPEYEERPRENWDCESVLTTRSTLYNHPAKLDTDYKRRQPRGERQIHLSSKTGLPTFADSRAEISHATEKPSSKAIPQARDPNETAAERKARKDGVKHAKREARAQKKEVKNIFKEEAQKQHRQAGNLHVSVSSLA